MQEKKIGTYELEICANSVLSAIAAEKGGATRIELCQNLEVGGTTPSYGQLIRCRELVHIGIHVLIRPRSGDFCYADEEITCILHDIQLCKSLGMNGVVIGALDKNGNIDKGLVNKLMTAAYPLHTTFHRAFDCTSNPHQALEDLIALGIPRVLTSGLKPTAIAGIPLIRELIQQARERITVMPGSGINSGNILTLLNQTGAKAFHSSAKKRYSSLFQFHPSANIGMNELQSLTDKEEVARISELLANNIYTYH